MDHDSIKSTLMVVGGLAIILSFILNTRKMRAEISEPEIQGKTLQGNTAVISGVKHFLTLKFIVNKEELMIRSIYPPKYCSTFSLSKLNGVRKGDGLSTHVDLSYVDSPELLIRISESLAYEIQSGSEGNWKFKRK